MTPSDLLTRLETEGVGVELSLKVSAAAPPSDDTRALVREHRAALLDLLARDLLSAPDCPHARSTGLTLYGDLLHSLLLWLGRYHELRLEHPGGVILGVKPEQATAHLTRSAWAVLYDATSTVLVTAGAVPPEVLAGKPVLRSVVAADETVTAKKLVN